MTGKHGVQPRHPGLTRGGQLGDRGRSHSEQLCHFVGGPPLLATSGCVAGGSPVCCCTSVGVASCCPQFGAGGPTEPGGSSITETIGACRGATGPYGLASQSERALWRYRELVVREGRDVEVVNAEPRGHERVSSPTASVPARSRSAP